MENPSVALCLSTGRRYPSKAQNNAMTTFVNDRVHGINPECTSLLLKSAPLVPPVMNFNMANRNYNNNVASESNDQPEQIPSKEAA